MTQTHPSDPAELQAFGATPDEVRGRLRAELDSMEAHLRTRQHDWTRVQAGREWTPAQEAEHVLLIDQSVMPLLRLLPSDKEIVRGPKVLGELVGGKRKSPASMEPSAEGLAWQDLDTRWAEHRQKLLALAEGVRPTPERTYWHPFYGELDALDWLRMVVGNIWHHRRLLEQSAA